MDQVGSQFISQKTVSACLSTSKIIKVTVPSLIKTRQLSLPCATPWNDMQFVATVETSMLGTFKIYEDGNGKEQ